MRAQPNKPIIGENLLYFLVWSLALLVPILNSKMMAEEHVLLGNILIVWSKLLPYIIIFFINNFWFAPKLLMRRRYMMYLGISLVMLSLIFLGLEYYQENIRTASTEQTTFIMHGKASFTDLEWYWNVLLGLFMCCANSMIKMMFKSMEEEQRMAEMERHRLQTEMEYLKYQINPHFFMNTLNNIHALIDIDTTAAQRSVIELSKMMRYVLYDSDNATIDIVNEVRFIENYIALMKIRYTEDIDVDMKVENPLPSNIKIPPLLLIVLVENAFKHGVSYNKRSYVRIYISCHKSSVICEVRNSRHHTQRKDNKASGLGLENMRKRLDLLFGNDYSLTIDESNRDEYFVKLKMPICDDEMFSDRR